ncbi:hypothetical protein [Stutzerimonas stutzeri]|uniref:Fis family transcriptional regulator n=1 Tax=Stutzerimonas stutzeri TaxID=316 RepID=A0A2N8RBP4_STUST|nr:hypothetical protein [Stutzerimonas stutzeri]MDH2244221.1 hypothetical protein [Pseudomonas sp. GD03909]EHY78833.1 hypothetical protein PstZobell_15514 [Stutzerimonas stutzeri ATCC 14405 = CCUG 16156]MCQ4255775.1 hypothetical protein [Stutzerimonas stutzeri]PNF58502.1 hypothetical protein CXK99_16250 [Stutzerimonas stutzeri]QOZ94006.1 hypothetical protein Pstu14405_00875 [Stutzerimonas stutzeri]
MPLSKRDQTRMERQLSSCLREACEAAKAEIVGFSWLTHEVDYTRFPESLQVTWIFATEAQRAQAIEEGHAARMQALTRAALAEAGIDMAALIAAVRFDSEEACKRNDGGDWQRRLARNATTRH